jgi:acetyl esterase/lipase
MKSCAICKSLLATAAFVTIGWTGCSAPNANEQAGKDLRTQQVATQAQQQQTANALPAGLKHERIHTQIVQYKRVEEISLDMHIVASESGRDRPAIVFFVCGGWRGFNPYKYYAQSQYLASRGVACFTALVRVRPRHGTTPAECVIDAKSAVRWVRGHAARYGVDPNRIAVAGASAAGHVAACTGLVGGIDGSQDDQSVSPRPDAMVLFCPVLVPHELQGCIESFGGTEPTRALSPILHVGSGAPPTIVMHGQDDERVPAEGSVRFAKAMNDAGNRCDIKLYEGRGHGFHNWWDGKNPMFYETLKQTDWFLISLGWLEGKPEVDTFAFDPPPAAKR